MDNIIDILILFIFVISLILVLIPSESYDDFPTSRIVGVVLLFTASVTGFLFYLHHVKVIHKLRTGKAEYTKEYTIRKVIRDSTVVKYDTTWDWKLIDKK